MDIAELLNLTKSLDNNVGSALLKGISGEDRGASSKGSAVRTGRTWEHPAWTRSDWDPLGNPLVR